MKRTMRDGRVLINLCEVDDGYGYRVIFETKIIDEGEGFSYRDAIRKASNAASLHYPDKERLYSIVQYFWRL